MVAILLNICPVEIDLCISRGDTAQWTFTILKADGVTPEDITGFSYLLTVDPSDEPTDAVNNLFQLTGIIPTGTDGLIQFSLTTGQADQVPQEYFFDLQQTDTATRIRTVAKGVFEFKQDISK